MWSALATVCNAKRPRVRLAQPRILAPVSPAGASPAAASATIGRASGGGEGGSTLPSAATMSASAQRAIGEPYSSRARPTVSVTGGGQAASGERACGASELDRYAATSPLRIAGPGSATNSPAEQTPHTSCSSSD